jgi:hypothetical protein
MDINNARNVITQMQACFMESNLKIVTESEHLEQNGYSHYVNFRSYVTDDNCLVEIQAFVYLNSDIVELSMFFQEEFPQETLGQLLALMNNINLTSAGRCWTAIPGFHKVECRSCYMLPGGQFDKELFKSVLKNFVDQGLLEYSYFMERMRNAGGLIN